MDANQSTPLPWMDQGNFPMPPDSESCGYLKKTKPVSCSRDELVEAIRNDTYKTIPLVWTGSGVPMLPPVEVPWLLKAFIERERGCTARQTTIGILNLVGWGFLALIGAISGHPPGWQIYLFNCLALGIIPLVENRWNLRGLRSMTKETLLERQISARYEFWLSLRKTPWTYCLAACITVVAIGQLAGRHSSVDAAGIVKPAIHAGEWWRLFTGTFLHGSILHFFFNILALLGLGRITETTFHRGYVPVVFVFSALAGSINSLIFLPGITSVGASGGIMGMVGFLLVIARLHKRDFPSRLRRSLLMATIYTAMAGAFAFRLVDNAAHLGGFVAGILLGLLVVRIHAVTIPDRNPPLWIPASIFAWIVIFATMLLCLWKFLNHKNGN